MKKYQYAIATFLLIFILSLGLHGMAKASGYYWILSIFGVDFSQELYTPSYGQCKEAAAHYIRHHDVTGVACIRAYR